MAIIRLKLDCDHSLSVPNSKFPEGCLPGSTSSNNEIKEMVIRHQLVLGSRVQYTTCYDGMKNCGSDIYTLRLYSNVVVHDSVYDPLIGH
jgi:hypothetical protein